MGDSKVSLSRHIWGSYKEFSRKGGNSILVIRLNARRPRLPRELTEPPVRTSICVQPVILIVRLLGMLRYLRPGIGYF